MPNKERQMTHEERRKLIETPIRIEIHGAKSHGGVNYEHLSIGHGPDSDERPNAARYEEDGWRN